MDSINFAVMSLTLEVMLYPKTSKKTRHRTLDRIYYLGKETDYDVKSLFVKWANKNHD